MYESLLWGCPLDEYRKMFALTDEDLNLSLLECGQGISAANAMLHQLNKSMISCNVLFNESDIKSKIEKKFHLLTEEVAERLEQFDFSEFGNFNAWKATRQKGIAQFFADYDLGVKDARYRPLSNDHFSFDDFAFDIALSGYEVFYHHDEQSFEGHLHYLLELARVAKEVCIFPIVDAEGQPSALLGPTLLALQQANYGIEICEVNHTLLRRSHAMLRVWARECLI